MSSSSDLNRCDTFRHGPPKPPIRPGALLLPPDSGDNEVASGGSTSTAAAAASFSSARKAPPEPRRSGRGPVRVRHDYHDYSKVLDANADAAVLGEKYMARRNMGGVARPFPVVLHAMLSRTCADEKEDDRRDGDDLDGDDDRRADRADSDGAVRAERLVIDWAPHGRCFLIKRPREFEASIMPRHFKHTKFTSFQRQLNLYGFKRITKKRDKGAYYHELFLRGKPWLAEWMVRKRVKGVWQKPVPDPDNEPDFYSMAYLPERGAAERGEDEDDEDGRRSGALREARSKYQPVRPAPASATTEAHREDSSEEEEEGGVWKEGDAAASDDDDERKPPAERAAGPTAAAAADDGSNCGSASDDGAAHRKKAEGSSSAAAASASDGGDGGVAPEMEGSAPFGAGLSARGALVAAICGAGLAGAAAFAAAVGAGEDARSSSDAETIYRDDRLPDEEEAGGAAPRGEPARGGPARAQRQQQQQQWNDGQQEAGQTTGQEVKQLQERAAAQSREWQLYQLGVRGQQWQEEEERHRSEREDRWRQERRKIREDLRLLYMLIDQQCIQIKEQQVKIWRKQERMAREEEGDHSEQEDRQRKVRREMMREDLRLLYMLLDQQRVRNEEQQVNIRREQEQMAREDAILGMEEEGAGRKRGPPWWPASPESTPCSEVVEGGGASSSSSSFAIAAAVEAAASGLAELAQSVVRSPPTAAGAVPPPPMPREAKRQKCDAATGGGAAAPAPTPSPVRAAGRPARFASPSAPAADGRSLPPLAAMTREELEAALRAATAVALEAAAAARAALRAAPYSSSMVGAAPPATVAMMGGPGAAMGRSPLPTSFSVGEALQAAAKPAPGTGHGMGTLSRSPSTVGTAGPATAVTLKGMEGAAPAAGPPAAAAAMRRPPVAATAPRAPAPALALAEAPGRSGYAWQSSGSLPSDYYMFSTKHDVGVFQPGLPDVLGAVGAPSVQGVPPGMPPPSA